MQRDVNAGESRTDHQDARGPTRPERCECAGCPRIQHNPAVGCRAGSQGRHRSEGAFQRVGHATFGASRREHDGVGRQRTPIAQRHARGCARHQPDNLRSLDPHPGGRELFLQIAPVGKTWREILHRRDGPFVEPAAEVIGIVRPYRHALRWNVQQEGRVVGAIRRSGTGTTGRVDQRDLRFGFAPAQMYRGQHARSTATHDHDAHHDGRLYRSEAVAGRITATAHSEGPGRVRNGRAHVFSAKLLLATRFPSDPVGRCSLAEEIVVRPGRVRARRACARSCWVP